MLTKLIRHEFRATSRIMWPIFAGMLALGIAIISTARNYSTDLTHLLIGKFRQIDHAVEQRFKLREKHLLADAATLTKEHHGFNHLRLALHAH